MQKWAVKESNPCTCDSIPNALPTKLTARVYFHFFTAMEQDIVPPEYQSLFAVDVKHRYGIRCLGTRCREHVSYIGSMGIRVYFQSIASARSYDFNDVMWEHYVSHLGSQYRYGQTVCIDCFFEQCPPEGFDVVPERAVQSDLISCAIGMQYIKKMKIPTKSANKT